MTSIRWSLAMVFPVSLFAQVAVAQPPPETTTTAPATTATPVAAPRPAATSAYGTSTVTTAPSVVLTPPARVKDHSKVVGSFGASWFGIGQVPIATGAGSAKENVETPVIGARYWFNEMVGIDAGIGFSTTSGSTKQKPLNGAAVSTDSPSKTGFLLHAGVPLALATGNHYIFEVVPEANVGFSTGNTGAQDASLSGFRIELGARAGAEIQFGFIGLPQLALEASVGLYLRRDSWSTDLNGASASGSNFQLATSIVNQPWDIFKGGVAARYYF